MLAKVAALVAGAGGRWIVRHSHMELAEPTIAQGFDACVAAGATHVTVHPYLLGPGRHATEDIPRLVAEAARRHPHVSFCVTEPLGVHEKIAEVILERVQMAEAQP